MIPPELEPLLPIIIPVVTFLTGLFIKPFFDDYILYRFLIPQLKIVPSDEEAIVKKNEEAEIIYEVSRDRPNPFKEELILLNKSGKNLLVKEIKIKFDEKQSNFETPVDFYFIEIVTKDKEKMQNTLGDWRHFGRGLDELDHSENLEGYVGSLCLDTKPFVIGPHGSQQIYIYIEPIFSSMERPVSLTRKFKLIIKDENRTKEIEYKKIVWENI